MEASLSTSSPGSRFLLHKQNNIGTLLCQLWPWTTVCPGSVWLSGPPLTLLQWYWLASGWGRFWKWWLCVAREGRQCWWWVLWWQQDKCGNQMARWISECQVRVPQRVGEIQVWSRVWLPIVRHDKLLINKCEISSRMPVVSSSSLTKSDQLNVVSHLHFHLKGGPSIYSARVLNKLVTLPILQALRSCLRNVGDIKSQNRQLEGRKTTYLWWPINDEQWEAFSIRCEEWWLRLS